MDRVAEVGRSMRAVCRESAAAGRLQIEGGSQGIGGLAESETIAEILRFAQNDGPGE